MPFYRLSSSFLLARAPTAILGHEVSLEMEITPRRSINADMAWSLVAL